MSHARGWASMTLATTIALSGCARDVTAPPRADIGDNPFESECNMGGFQFRTAVPLGKDAPLASVVPHGGAVQFGYIPPQHLQQVIVYGTPVQRPYRGYGDPGSYGGITTTYTYDRDILDQCAFGAGTSFVPVGEVREDTLDVPIDPPDGIPEDVWRSIPPRVKKQLREAANYLADHWIPNDLPILGSEIREIRRGMIFAALAKGYFTSLDATPDRRRETIAFYNDRRQTDRGLTNNETLRLDAFLLGCSTAAQFRNLDSWNASTAEDWASRVVAGWAGDQTEDYALRYLEPQLSYLGALGAANGRIGNSCGQAAHEHFLSRPADLTDAPQNRGGGGGDGTQL